MPISLSDSELQTVIDASTPLTPAARVEFLQTVAAELSKHSEIGGGLVNRTVRDVLRKYFDPPTLTNHRGKYNR